MEEKPADTNKNAEETSEITSKEVEKCEENEDLVAGEEDKSIENNN